MASLPSLPKINLTRKQFLILGSGTVLILVIIFLIFTNLRPHGEQAEEVTLTVWGILDETEALKNVFSGYSGLRPNVKIVYRQIDEENYERTLLDKLAAGEGPDVFMIKNGWIPEHKDKLFWIEKPQLNAVGASRLSDMFPEVVERDYSDSGGRIYALPLYLDTLALYYNRDFLNNAGIVYPPKNWTEFQNVVQRLRILNPAGQIVKAGAALGGSDRSIENAADIISLLMLQNGAPMTSEDFSSTYFGHEGRDAFVFYLNFANAASPFYTWNDSLGSATQGFAEGRVAMLFHYRRAASDIREKAPFLNFGIAPMPQIEGSDSSINYASYWGFAVSKQSKAPNWAWDFVLQVTTNARIIRPLTDLDGYPPALRSLIDEKLSDPELGIFSRQALTAKSWYYIDEDEVRKLFSRGVSRVLSGQISPEAALGEIEAELTALMESAKKE